MVRIVLDDSVSKELGERPLAYLQSTASFDDVLSRISDLGYHTVYVRENDRAGIPGYVELSPNTDPIVYIDFDSRYKAVGQGRFNTVEEIFFHEFTHIALGHLEGDRGFEAEAEAIKFTNDNFRREVGLPDRVFHEINDIRNGAQFLSDQCFGASVPIEMWPKNDSKKPNGEGRFNECDVRECAWVKPIDKIEVGDIVVSFDEKGILVPGHVTRIFRNDVKILLNFHGTQVTPGHVYFRPDSQRPDKFETLIDILREDGVIQRQDGTWIRAATNVPVGEPHDGFVLAIAGRQDPDGAFVETERAYIRLGTRFIVDGKRSYCVADLIAANGGVVDGDGMIRVGDSDPMAFYWEFGDRLPRPEDFVLACSATTLEEIYKVGEWEEKHPRMPSPMVRDGGPVQPLSEAARAMMPRNEPWKLE